MASSINSVSLGAPQSAVRTSTLDDQSNNGYIARISDIPSSYFCNPTAEKISPGFSSTSSLSDTSPEEVQESTLSTGQLQQLGKQRIQHGVIGSDVILPANTFLKTDLREYSQPTLIPQKRRVKLIKNQTLNVDYPVPSAIRNSVQPKYRDAEYGSEEFTHMRYTAATCDPEDYTLKNAYNLRPSIYNRHTELFVGITYYNENKVLLSRSLHSIMENIRDIVNLKRSDFWNKGGPAWQKIVACVVIDGIDACDKGVLDVLATIGVFQHDIMKKDVGGKATVAHIFEYTTQLSVTERQQLMRPKDDTQYTLPPVQLILCIKQRNSRKINSHRWMWSAFGRILNPEVVVTVDVGTKLLPKALLGIWEAFYNDKDLAGACGEVHCTLKTWKDVLNPIVAAQHFEYKVSYQLDRALEATLGYVTVLPGAFSGYRYRAIMGRPLEQYYYGDPTLFKSHGAKAIKNSALKSNMYLAEDRMLCLESIMKAGSKWHLGFVKGAKAETDNPTNMVDLIIQRRRWLNGAFAVSLWSIIHVNRLHKSGHNITRLILLYIQVIYNITCLLLSWFALSAFLLTLFIVNDISGDPPLGTPASGFPFGRATPIVNAVIQAVYLSTLILQFILALGSRPRRQYISYFLSFAIFGIIQVYFIMNAIYLVKKAIQYHYFGGNGADSYNYINEYYANIGSLTVTVAAFSVFGVYVAAGILSLDPWHLFTSFAQYLFVSSSYTNILTIYAFCNTHDVSWGDKIGRGPSRVDSLPSASVIKTSNGDIAAVEDTDAHENIDIQFEKIVRRTLTPYEPSKIAQEKATPEDKLKTYRTRILAAYIFSNFFLIVFILNDSFKSFHWLGDSYWHKIWFFRIWLWANSAVFTVRFTGCVFHRARRLLLYFFSRR